MKIKTSELIGAALDWAVEECEFRERIRNKEHIKSWVLVAHKEGKHTNPFSSDWLWGGSIIEQWAIDLLYRDSVWRALRHVGDWPTMGSGPTPLIAAMRCYVSSRLGDEVEIPELT